MPRYENTPLSADYKDVLRRREIARAMQERSFMPTGSEMVSGHVIPNWGRGVSNIGRAAVSSIGSKKAGEMEQALSDKYDTESKASMQKVMDTLQGGNPRQAAMDATVDPYLRSNRSTQSVIDAMIKADAVKNRGSGNPYYKPIYDKEGNIYSFDARSANVAPVSSGGGQLSDPRYATSSRRNIKAAEQMGTGTAEAITDPVTEYNKAIAEREAEKVITKPQIESGLASVEAKTGMLDEAIDKAIDESGAFTAGFLGSATSWAPGTPAYDLGNTLSTIKANIGFDKLREMRDNSPTGGALGQVSKQPIRRTMVLSMGVVLQTVLRKTL